MCSQHNVRATAGDNTGQNTDKGHTPSPRIEINIPDPAGNRTRAAGLEGGNSTDHATATDKTYLTPINLLQKGIIKICLNNPLIILLNICLKNK